LTLGRKDLLAGHLLSVLICFDNIYTDIEPVF